MIKLGRHLIVEFWKCINLNDSRRCVEALVNATNAINATLLEVRVIKFNPQGLSGIAIIGESHISVHTWPELRYAAIDIFTCKKDSDPYLAVEPLKEWLSPQEIQIMEIARGILSEPCGGERKPKSKRPDVLML